MDIDEHIRKLKEARKMLEQERKKARQRVKRLRKIARKAEKVSRLFREEKTLRKRMNNKIDLSSVDVENVPAEVLAVKRMEEHEDSG